ncbi:MAG: DUF4383 domain-containing protein [Nitriliruptorales bacterium]
MDLSAKSLGTAFGAVYLAVGVIGFALTGFGGFFATQGDTLLFFEINPAHNVVHILVGAVLLSAAAAGERLARQTWILIGSVYALVGVVGFALIGTQANVLALNAADNLLHLVTAAVALFAVVYSRRTSAV